MFKHVLIPTDGSALSERAISRAIAFAQETGARLTFFSAVAAEPLPYVGEAGEHAGDTTECVEAADAVMKKALDKAQAEASAAGVTSGQALVHAEVPHDAIIAAAQTLGCDLIVMASHGRQGVTALLLGSVTQKVLTHTKIPVLVVR